MDDLPLDSTFVEIQSKPPSQGHQKPQDPFTRDACQIPNGYILQGLQGSQDHTSPENGNC